MCVGAVGSVGSGSSGINPILIERYAVINKQLRLRRIKKEEKIFKENRVCWDFIK